MFNALILIHKPMKNITLYDESTRSSNLYSQLSVYELKNYMHAEEYENKSSAIERYPHQLSGSQL